MKRILIAVGAAMLAAAGFNAEEPAATLPEQYAGNVASMGGMGPSTLRIQAQHQLRLDGQWPPRPGLHRKSLKDRAGWESGRTVDSGIQCN